MIDSHHNADAGKQSADVHLEFAGVTDVGKKREHNEDQYLICTLHKHMRVLDTSLQTVPGMGLTSDSLAYLAVVADGVGGHLAGEEASRLTLEQVATYVTHGMQCYYTGATLQEEEFQTQLRDAVDQCHNLVLSEAHADRRGMATTLTLVMVMWPRAFVAQVGDSRAYLLRKGELVRLTRDQTVAQEMYDKGMLSTNSMKLSPMRNVLTSAIGGSSIKSATTLVDLELGDVLMLCSDGLSDLVSDERITSHLSQHPQPADACRALVDDALAEGGRDNITVVVGRSLPPD